MPTRDIKVVAIQSSRLTPTACTSTAGRSRPSGCTCWCSPPVPEQRSGHHHLRKLEHDVAAVADDPGADLDQHDPWSGIVFLMSATSARGHDQPIEACQSQ